MTHCDPQTELSVLWILNCKILDSAKDICNQKLSCQESLNVQQEPREQSVDPQETILGPRVGVANQRLLGSRRCR